MLVFFSLAGFLVSCRQYMWVAMDTHTRYDEYFFLYRNGRYSIKVKAAEQKTMQGNDKGYFTRSGDTIYFVKKRSWTPAQAYGIGIIDTARKLFLYRPDQNDLYRIYTLTEPGAVRVP